MDWSDIGRVVAKTAPVLGSVLGGPAGAVAGAAGALVGSWLGVEPEPDAVAEAVRNPEMLLKLRALEEAHRERIMEWQSTQLQAEVENVRDARRREVELARAGHGGAWVTAAVALVVISGFFWMLNIVVGTTTVNEPALLLLGSLGTAFGAVVNYYLGSSLGSFRKDAAFGFGASGASVYGSDGAINSSVVNDQKKSGGRHGHA